MKIYGWTGLLLLIFSECGLFCKIEPFDTWFYCFAWWSYILLADNLLLIFRGRSLLLGRLREFRAMIPISIFVWLVFEAFNFRVQNWSYSIPPMETWQRWAGYLISYATVLPGIFITADLVELFWKRSGAPFASECNSQDPRGMPRHSLPCIVFGFCLTIAPLIWPGYLFPMVWVGPVFLLNPLLGKFGKQWLSFKTRSGHGKRVWSLMLAGLICGLMWEFWNYWAGSRWIYSVPFFGEWKVFEMPVLGFLGFPPFALECWVLYHLIQAVLHSMSSRLFRFIWWLGMGIISVLILLGIDAYTVAR
jgi:hypothetical protein